VGRVGGVTSGRSRRLLNASRQEVIIMTDEQAEDHISLVIWKDKGQKENWVGMGKKIGARWGSRPQKGR
jgi:hypothetical protein